MTLPKPMTSGIEAKGRFGKQDFVYLSDEDVYRCPAGEKLKYYYTNEEKGQKLRRYWTNACRHCALKHRCTTGPQRRITRWEHEHVLEAARPYWGAMLTRSLGPPGDRTRCSPADRFVLNSAAWRPTVSFDTFPPVSNPNTALILHG